MVPGSQRLPTPHRAYFRLPSPSPADAAVHTLYLLLFWLCIPLPSPWEEPVGWQLGRSLLSPLWVPASPLTSAWTPCARVRPLGASQGCPRPFIPLQGDQQPLPCHLCPYRDCTPARVEVRARPGRGDECPWERQKLWVWWLRGENNSMEPPLQAN